MKGSLGIPKGPDLSLFGGAGGNSQDREKYGLVCERLSRIQVPRNPNSDYPRVRALRVCVCVCVFPYLCLAKGNLIIPVFGFGVFWPL